MPKLYVVDTFYFVPKKVYTRKANNWHTSDLLTQDAIVTEKCGGNDANNGD